MPPPPSSATRRRGAPAVLASALAVVLASVVALAGCSSSGSDGGTTTTTDPLSHVKVAAASGGEATPTVTVSGAPLHVGTTTREVLRRGSGTTARAGDAVVVRFEGVNARTGTSFGSDFGQAPASFVLGSQVIAGFRKALTGVRAGSRVLSAVSPADGYGTKGVSSLKIKKNDSLVYLIDVLAVTRARASGAAQPAPGAGLPTVTLASDGEPTITVPAGVAAPTTLTSKTLIEGSGPAVKSGQYVTVQYSGINYRTGKVFDSSWSRQTPATFQIGVGQVVSGWDKTIVGAKVGSQLLLVIPPADGYGAAGQSQIGIEGTDTLVFVVDVLAATD